MKKLLIILLFLPFFGYSQNMPGSWQRGTITDLNTGVAWFLSQNTDALEERTFTIDTISKWLGQNITITESQVSDLDHFNATDFQNEFWGSSLNNLANVTVTGVAVYDYLRWSGSAWVNESDPTFLSGYAIFNSSSGDSEVVIKSASKTAYTFTAENGGFGNFALNRGIDEIYEFDVLSGWIYRDEFLIDPSEDGNTPLTIVGNGALDNDVMIKIENISGALPSTYLRFEDGLNNVFDVGSDGTDFKIGSTFSLMGEGGVKLTPQSAEPTSPELGMMYVDSDDSNLYFYNGSTWEQISP